jgi:hypothetical protein
VSTAAQWWPPPPDVRLPVMDGALCASHPDPDLWFDALHQAAAMAVCQGCPVRAACDAWATETGQTLGVWGGVPRWPAYQESRRRERRQGAA